uniref:G-protein coupled receptors family 1 profile domain-containing protein n=1 Tax=Amphiprion percula TaxID=161767 RepID=A0A3P8T7H7_AMPPE
MDIILYGQEKNSIIGVEEETEEINLPYDQTTTTSQQLLFMSVMEEPELCFPQLFNSSCRRMKRSHSEAMLVHILLSYGCWFLGDFMCTLYQYLAYIITSASIGTMVMISIDRYVAVCYPLHYSIQITQQRVQICVYLCWISSAIFQTLVLKDALKQPGRYKSCVGECAIVTDYISGLADVIFSFIVPITIIIVLYVRVFVVAVSQAHAMHSQLVPTKHSVTATVQKSELKAARTLGVVVVVFIICMCPYYCVALTGQETLLNSKSTAFVICLFYFNSCLNPIIYAFLYPWFRKSLIVTFKIFEADSCESLLGRNKKKIDAMDSVESYTFHLCYL